MGLARRDVREHQLHAAGDHVDQPRGIAGVGHAQHLDAGTPGKHLAHDQARRVAGSEAQRLRVRFGIGDQFGCVLRRHRGVHHQQARESGHHGHRHEVLGRVVAQLGHQAGVGAVGRVGAHQQRQAVRRRARHGGGRDRAVGAGAVFDRHRLLERRLQMLGQQPCRGVGAAGRAERHDDLDGLVRIRVGRLRAAGQGQPRRNEPEMSSHAIPFGAAASSARVVFWTSAM